MPSEEEFNQFVNVDWPKLKSTYFSSKSLTKHATGTDTHKLVDSVTDGLSNYQV